MVREGVAGGQLVDANEVFVDMPGALKKSRVASATGERLPGESFNNFGTVPILARRRRSEFGGTVGQIDLNHC